MKVIEKRVFSRLLSYVLAVALMAGLMPGVVAKADTPSVHVTLENGTVLKPGDTIKPNTEGIQLYYLEINGPNYKQATLTLEKDVDYLFSVVPDGDDVDVQHPYAYYLTKVDPGGYIKYLLLRTTWSGGVKLGKATSSSPFGYSNPDPDQPSGSDEDEFNAEKEAQKKAADGLLKSDDSEACKKLVEDAKKTIDETKYDKSKDLDANKKGLADIVTKLEKDLEEQRKKDLEEQRKKDAETAAEDPDTVVHPDGSKTVTEVKTSGNNTEITVTDYNKDGSQLAQYIYNGASGENLDLRTINYSGKNIVIPDTVTGGGKTYKVTRLRKNFMKKCKKARKVDVGENVNRIDKGAFNGGKKVRYITIRGKLKKVGAGAFKALKKGTIKFKTSKKVYRHNVKLVEKSGLNPNIKVKRIKKK
ncbi:leucine-rich repeat protein [Butyrivibrio sp. XPD2002]|uniref:leucine-rich repeat protein n=1 Tax=Butyrivibrio sp. XPD2002 TaxID=1280665 RepID=UPI0004204344|nr:leucine-rich repeat protein [Butyrivibrio sp. XPD2002]